MMTQIERDDTEREMMTQREMMAQREMIQR